MSAETFRPPGRVQRPLSVAVLAVLVVVLPRLGLVSGRMTARAADRLVLGALAMVLVLVSPAVAQGSVDLSLPDDASLSADAGLVPDDDPGPAPATLDLAAAEETVVAQADLLLPERWEMPALTAALGPEPAAAFAFVRAAIAFDPYPGLLRGPEGTLAARAGGSLDRAALLKALLEVHGHSARFAFGELDPSTADRVLARAFPPAATPITDPDVAAVTTLDVPALVTRARRDHARLTVALGGPIVPGAADGSTAATPDVRRHAWVQVAEPDGSWLDLDPTFPDAQPGDVLVPASETAEAAPEADRQAVVIRVVADLETATGPETRTLLDERIDAPEAAEAELWLTFQRADPGVAGAIEGALGGGASVPVLVADGEGRVGAVFPTQAGGSETGGGGLFGDGEEEAIEVGDFFGGEGGPRLVRLALELGSLAPGHEPLVAERVLFDADDPDGDSLEDALAGLHHVMVSTGGASLRDHAVGRAFAANFAANDLRDAAVLAELPLHDLLLPLAVADQTLVVGSERVIVDGLAAQGTAGVRAFVGRPRIFLSTLAPFRGVEGGSAIVTDLALDDLWVALAPDRTPADGAAYRLWYGTLQSALETELALGRARAVDPDGRVLRSVSLAMDGELRLLAGQGEGASPAVDDALATGDLVVLVGDQASGATFWAVDPGTGLARAVVEPGLRVGFIGGGNYVNSSGGGPRYIVDPRTGNTLGFERDGRTYLYRRNPPTRCSGGTEYVVILDCVSIPASWATGVLVGATVVAVVAWSIVIFTLAGP